MVYFSSTESHQAGMHPFLVELHGHTDQLMESARPLALAQSGPHASAGREPESGSVEARVQSQGEHRMPGPACQTSGRRR